MKFKFFHALNLIEKKIVKSFMFLVSIFRPISSSKPHEPYLSAFLSLFQFSFIIEQVKTKNITDIYYYIVKIQNK